MNPEDDLAQRRAERDRGQRAQRIYEDDLFIGAIEAIKDDAWRRFAASDLKDDRERLIQRLRIDVIDQIATAMRTHMTTGKMAEGQIPFLEKALRKLRA